MINIRQEIPLLSYNTFGIPATAAVFVESDSVSELTDYIRSVSNPSSVLLLGGGSNILFVAARCETVIHSVMKGIELMDETDDSVLVRASSGEIWDDFVSWCISRNYAGIENLSHIPGTVGACPVQNIGAYGVEAKDAVEKVEAIEMNTCRNVTFDNQQCMFGYRDSFFKKNKGKYFITAVHFRLSKKFAPNLKYADIRLELPNDKDITIENIRQAIIKIRNGKLPNTAKTGNAGSFFKNPTIGAEKAKEITEQYPQASLYPVSHKFWKISAAWLIQQCGWQGIRDGNVCSYKSQPIVIVNCGGATGSEILDFANKIIDSVKVKFDIELEPEVNIVW